LRPFFCQKPLKIAILLHSSKKIKKQFFLESNCRILYLIYLRSCGKNFIKFDCIVWKMWAFKVQFFFLNCGLQFQMTLIAICGIFFLLLSQWSSGGEYNLIGESVQSSKIEIYEVVNCDWSKPSTLHYRIWIKVFLC